MVKDEKFLIQDKVYMFCVTLTGYDDCYVSQELNRLISLGLVKKVRNATEQDLERIGKLRSTPIGGY